METDLGTVEPGKLANLIVVKGDPLKNIACLLER
jgi:imidazolonepropionase-like amidohydrolase